MKNITTLMCRGKIMFEPSMEPEKLIFGASAQTEDSRSKRSMKKRMLSSGLDWAKCGTFNSEEGALWLLNILLFDK